MVDNGSRGPLALPEGARLVSPGRNLGFDGLSVTAVLQAMRQAGVTIVTQDINKPFYEKSFANARTLNPDRLERSKKKPVIETVGEKLAWSLIQNQLVYDPSDLYPLTKDQLTALERMGDKSAQNVLDNIEASKDRTLTRVLYALGIRYVGYQTAELLGRAFGTMDRVRGASLDDILAVEGIGPKIAESVYAWFHEPDNLRLVDKLAAAGVNMSEDAAMLGGPLAGLTIVVTGRLERQSRGQIEQRIKELGGAVGDAVSKKTSYLVAGDDAGSKLAKAQKLGTPILDEAAFEALIAEKTHA